MKIIIIQALASLEHNTIDCYYSFALTQDISPEHNLRVVKNHLEQRDITPDFNITYTVLETPAPPEGMTIAPIDYAAAIINTVEHLTDKHGSLESMPLCIIEELTRFLRTVSQINSPEHSMHGLPKKTNSRTIHQIEPETALIPYEFLITTKELSLIPLIAHTEIINDIMATLGIRFRLAIPQTIAWTPLDTDEHDEHDGQHTIPTGIVFH